MKYIVSWNDEYLDLQIVGGPFISDKTAEDAMKDVIATRLVELDVAENTKQAEELCLAAEKTPEDFRTAAGLISLNLPSSS